MLARTASNAIPALFNRKNAASWNYRPDIGSVFNEANIYRRAWGLKPSARDDKKVHMLLIDDQRDFCFPEGTLYVAGRSGTGAIDDSARTAEFIYRNIGMITKITPTLDTHLLYQIFFPSFWEKDDGTPVSPHTVITVADLDAGKFRVAPIAAAALGIDYVWLTKYVRHYTSELEKAGKYTLYVWPYHCLLGTEGHSLVGILQEALAFHAFARGSALLPETKGGNPLTENYSVLRPEVLTAHDGHSIAQKNVRFIKTLLEADRVIVQGQAASHCDKSTIEDLLAEILAKDPASAQKVYLLEDCMSAVTVPDGKGGFIVDYTDQAEEALRKFKAAGMHVVRSTDPVDSWKDF